MSRNIRGFTIVELMLAMTVLSVLLLSIAMLIIQIGHVYSRGVTLKSLNQTATTLSRDIQTTLNQADSAMVQYVGLASKSGRLCTGDVTYAWNSVIDTTRQDQARNFYTGNEHNQEIRFVRVTDKQNKLCEKNAQQNYPELTYADTHELLPSGQYDFAMYEFYVGSRASSRSLHWVVMKLGSTNSDDVDTVQEKCLVGQSGMGDFCAINIFEFTAGSR